MENLILYFILFIIVSVFIFLFNKYSKRNIKPAAKIYQDNEFNEKYEKTNTLFINCLKNYNSEFCQCAFPRFHQITGIDCAETNHSFKCWETELLINDSKAYFDIDKSNPISTPIPLYLGLMGHSFPKKKIEINVAFEEFENYMNEK